MALNTTTHDPAAVLQFLLDSGTIKLDDVATEMTKAQRKRIIDNHPYEISEGADGRWRTYIKPNDGKRKMIAKSSHERLVDALVEFYTSEPTQHSGKSLTVEDLYPKWLEYKKLHAASSTYLIRIESNWKNYYAGTDIIRKPVAELTKLDLDVWCHKLIERVDRRKKEFYNVSMLMRQILDYSVDLELITNNPLKQVKIDARMVFKPVKRKANETQVFSKGEVTELFEDAWNDFESGHNLVHKLAPLAVMFQFLTGVRIGEVCVLKYEDILDKEMTEIYVQRMYRFKSREVVDYTKCHNEGRAVILTSEARKLIQAAKHYQEENGLDSTGYIFSVNDQPLSYYAVRKLYERYCQKLGTINKSSHKARKTYISALIAAGVGIDTVRAQAGHSDARITYQSYVYDRSTKSERAELIEKALA